MFFKLIPEYVLYMQIRLYLIVYTSYISVLLFSEWILDSKKKKKLSKLLLICISSNKKMNYAAYLRDNNGYSSYCSYEKKYHMNYNFSNTVW